MPATTRSRTQQKQTHLEDFESKPAKKEKARSSNTKRSQPQAKKDTNGSSKRTRTDDGKDATTKSTPAKKPKQASIKPDENVATSDDSKPVIINRAPVLQLWAACVAQKIHPELSWDTHLSIGSAISTLCAVSKGRAIGTIDQPSEDPNKKAEKGRKKRTAKEGADDEVHVMGFKLLLQDGCAIVSGKSQKGSEGLLKKKYGEGDYDRVKKAMEEAVAVAEEEAKHVELNRTAFRMYEEFRPNIQHGQGGWGKKGELKLEKIKEVAEKCLA